MSASVEQARRLEELHGQLAAEVEALCSGADWRRWLDTASRLHQYSFNNVLLIQAQAPGATMVAGYRAWQRLGRQVDRGEKSIRILAPVRRRTATGTSGGNRDLEADGGGTASGGVIAGGPSERADPGEGAGGEGAEPEGTDEATAPYRRTRVVGWRVAHVWDVGQTSGDPLPAPPSVELLEGQAPAGLWDALAGEVTGRGFTVERGDCGQANGRTDFTTGTVRVRADVDDAQAVKTLAHELGHVLLHDPGDFPGRVSGACRGAAEVEAESLAYLVAAAAELDTGAYTFGYVASWAASDPDRAPAKVVAATGQRVLGATTPLLERITPLLAPDPPENTAQLTATRQLETPLEPETMGSVTPVLAEAAYRSLPSSVAAGQVADGVRLDSLDRLYAVHADAAAFFRSRLVEPSAAGPRNYLTGRGLGHLLGTSRWEVGYAPASWTSLTEHLRTLGYSEATLAVSGLCLRSRYGDLVDRFRDRLTVGIRNPDGHLVGFIGRAVPDAGAGVPKYLNSPTTPVFDKGTLLLGLPEQTDRLAADGVPVLVEGPLDLLAVDASNRPELPPLVPVAPCGTALTSTQAEALGRHASGPVLVAFDADHAGAAAAARAYSVLRDHAHPLLAATLPAGSDPGDLLTDPGGPDRVRKALSATRPLADVVVDHHLSPWMGEWDNAEACVAALRAAAPAVAALHPDEVAGQAGRLSAILRLDAETVSDELAAAVTHPPHGRGRAPAPTPTTASPSVQVRTESASETPRRPHPPPAPAPARPAQAAAQWGR